MLEQELRDRLQTIDVPPSRLDPSRMLTVGRRASRMRTAQASAGVVLTVGALVAVPSFLFRAGGTPDGAAASPVTTTCPVTRLPVPAGMTNVAVNAIDRTGKYIVAFNISRTAETGDGTVDGPPESQPVLWTDGKPERLPSPTRATRPASVNANGVIAAAGGNGKEWDTIIRYVDRQPEILKPPPGGKKWIFDSIPKVNAAGDVAASSPGNGVLLWRAGSSTPIKVPVPAKTWLAHLTDDRRIVGRLISADGQHVSSHIWTETGAESPIPAPKGQEAAVYTGQGDWLTGNLQPSGTVARWNIDPAYGVVGLTDLGLPSPSNAINGNGWVLAENTVQRDDATVTLAQVPGDRDPAYITAVADTGLVVGNRITSDRAGNVTSMDVLTWNCADPGKK